MAPLPSTTSTSLSPLSPAELAYLHTSLSLHPPIRSDARLATQFRPLSAEADVLPGCNGSARVCLADGTEAVVGVKAEVERSRPEGSGEGWGGVEDGEDDGDTGEEVKGQASWLELSIEIPGVRDDDPLSVFLAAMLAEALVVDDGLVRRLVINRGWHWRVYVDVRTFLFYTHGYGEDVRKISTQEKLHPKHLISKNVSLTTGTTDPSPLTTTFLPSSAPLPHHSPRPPLHTPPTIEVRGGGRSTLRRRLGRGGISVSADQPFVRFIPSKSIKHVKTTDNPPRHLRRSEHPLRPDTRRNRRRGRRICRLRRRDTFFGSSIQILTPSNHIPSTPPTFNTIHHTPFTNNLGWSAERAEHGDWRVGAEIFGAGCDVEGVDEGFFNKGRRRRGRDEGGLVSAAWRGEEGCGEEDRGDGARSWWGWRGGAEGVGGGGRWVVSWSRFGRRKVISCTT